MAYIVASALKELLSKNGMMCAGDLPEALSASVEAVLTKAIERCKGNDRVTVRPCDL